MSNTNFPNLQTLSGCVVGKIKQCVYYKFFVVMANLDQRSLVLDHKMLAWSNTSEQCGLSTINLVWMLVIVTLTFDQLINSGHLHV